MFSSGKLVQSLMQLDLVDEYRLMVYPVVIGGGQRLFEEGLDKKAFMLADTQTFKTGVAVLTYRREK